MGRTRIAEKRVLLVEDERELRELLALGLRRAGYAVDVAATASEARELIEPHSYTLVIADWLLPDGNGIDLADRALEKSCQDTDHQRVFVRFASWRGAAASATEKAVLDR